MRKTIVLGTALVLLQIPLLAYVLLQERTWGGPERDGAQGVAVAGDGSVYVTGETRSFGAGGGDAFLLKYNASGALDVAADVRNRAGRIEQRRRSRHPRRRGAGQFRRAGAGELPRRQHLPRQIQPLRRTVVGPHVGRQSGGGERDSRSRPNGTIYVAGVTFDFTVGQGDAFLLSFSPAGALNWQRTWGGEFFDAARDVAVATDGGVFISGETVFTANAAFLVKFGADGSVIWEREWGLVGRDGAQGETLGNGVAAAPGGRRLCGRRVVQRRCGSEPPGRTL